ncbi:ParB N-terminal domain-containing protein [Sphingomonas naphthae]|uniref:ParB N-terminal domain-containing protein n=1 Tax=Sphingomonas naphthae TaxID=1813468 RepID=A0ABY7TGZ8_9SPHN|nr:ParB N-terminal domain-containing protein [Sphingomonas naphthae]WCT72086.1 ParB N-terminal domain-containing protein [Sphingomonas naphthae]
MAQKLLAEIYAGSPEGEQRARLAAPTVVGEIILVETRDVRIGQRLRAVDPMWASALGQIMVAEGQKTEIEVCRVEGEAGWLLVAGAHRVTGAQLAGIEYLRAKVVEADAQERIAREVSENLWRRGLDPIDRASFIAELVALHKERNGIDPEKDGRAVSIATRWQKALKAEACDTNETISFVYGWSEQIGTSLGLGRRSIELDLLLHRRLAPSLIARLRNYADDDGIVVGHPILKNASQLRALAKLDERQQGLVVTLLVGDQAKTVSGAVSTLQQKPRQSPEDKALSAFIGSFGRMGLTEKKGALSQLIGMMSGSLIDHAIAELKKGGNL